MPTLQSRIPKDPTTAPVATESPPDPLVLSYKRAALYRLCGIVLLRHAAVQERPQALHAQGWQEGNRDALSAFLYFSPRFKDVPKTELMRDNQLNNYYRREYGWRGEYQVGIDKKNNNGGRDGKIWRLKQMPCPTDAIYQQYPS